MAQKNETNRVRDYWDRAAGGYDRLMSLVEKVMLGDGRRWAGEQAGGDVLEIGIGTGLSLPAYPPTCRLTGVDLSEQMLNRARARARDAGGIIDLRIGDAQALDFPDASFDTVVFSLSLCSIPDDRAAIREAYRVLRPGGRVVAIEHVGSDKRVVRLIQRVIDYFTSRLQGDHQLRQPAQCLREQGFAIDYARRSKLGIIQRVVAVKPA